MEMMQLAQIIIGSIVSLGVLSAGFGYAYGQFYKGRDDQTKEDFSLFNTRLDGLQKICVDQEKEIEKQKKDIQDLTRDIGRLQGVNEEKEKKIIELTNLLQNRDPHLLEFIQFSKESILNFKKMTQEILDTLTDLKNRAV